LLKLYEKELSFQPTEDDNGWADLETVHKNIINFADLPPHSRITSSPVKAWIGGQG
jgi:hypothetical protein